MKRLFSAFSISLWPVRRAGIEAGKVYLPAAAGPPTPRDPGSTRVLINKIHDKGEVGAELAIFQPERVGDRCPQRIGFWPAMLLALQLPLECLVG
jgi:hypothetical protein